MIRLMFLALSILFFYIWIKAIIEIAQVDSQSNDKVVWLLIVILLPCLGSILYYLIGREKLVGKDWNEFV